MTQHNQSPSARYHELIEQGLLTLSAPQCDALTSLDVLYQAHRSRRVRYPRFKRRCKHLYLWGSVGSGKTMLTDILCETLPAKRYRRLHAHDWLRQIHQDLRGLQGRKDPLKWIAQRFKRQASLWIIDEFEIHDIADACLIGKLIQAMQTQTTLVFTSNTAPDKLYEHGLQRQRFLPTIRRIQETFTVVHLQSQHDWRQAQQPHLAGRRFCYADPNTAMAERFQKLTGHPPAPGVLKLNGRTLTTQGSHQATLWLTWQEALGSPRCYRDYLSLAKHYDTLLLSDSQPIQASQSGLLMNWIHLVDIWYDYDKVLYLDTAIEPLMQAHRQHPRAQRTRSRLTSQSF